MSTQGYTFTPIEPNPQPNYPSSFKTQRWANYRANLLWRCTPLFCIYRMVYPRIFSLRKRWSRDGSVLSTERGWGSSLHLSFACALGSQSKPKMQQPRFRAATRSHCLSKTALRILCFLSVRACPVCLLHHYHPIKILFCNNLGKTLPQSLSCLPKCIWALPKSSFPLQLPRLHTTMLSWGAFDDCFTSGHTRSPSGPTPPTNSTLSL